MTTARDLVNAIQSGKSATIQATFDSLMTEKIQFGIESYRQAVIDNTFNPELLESDEDESAVDSSIDADLQLEDYSLEEIQEFMESEDFETLDELSKSTLASYVNKASQDAAYRDRLSANAHKAAQKVKFKTRADKDQMIDRAEKYSQKSDSRKAGIKKAIDKLTK